MSFSFCLNKADLLVLCGMALLYQGLELKQDSKLLKDNEKVVNAVIKTVGQMKASVAYDFQRVAGLLIKVEEPQQLPTPPPGGYSPDLTNTRRGSQKESPSRPKKKSSSSSQANNNSNNQSQQYSIGRHSSVSETDLLTQQEKLRRMAMPAGMTQHRHQQQQQQPAGSRGTEAHRSSSRSSLDSARPNAASLMQRRDQRLSMSQAAMIARVAPAQQQKPNLDYLALGNSLQQQQQHSPPPSQHAGLVSPTIGGGVSSFYATPMQQQQQQQQKLPTTTTSSSSGGILASEWEALLGSIDGGASSSGAGQSNSTLSYDSNMYCGPGQLSLDTPVTSSTMDGSWSPESLDLSTFNLGDFGNPHHGDSSLSEESLSSVSGGDDFSSLDFHEFATGGIMSNEGFVLDGVRRGSQYL